MLETNYNCMTTPMIMYYKFIGNIFTKKYHYQQINSSIQKLVAIYIKIKYTTDIKSAQNRPNLQQGMKVNS